LRLECFVHFREPSLSIGILALDPSKHDLRPALASAYVHIGLHTLAPRTLRELLRWTPCYPKAEAARHGGGPGTRPAGASGRARRGGEAGLRLAELHEEVQSALNQSDFALARQVAQAALRQKPDIPAVLNNLTQAYAADG